MERDQRYNLRTNPRPTQKIRDTKTATQRQTPQQQDTVADETETREKTQVPITVNELEDVIAETRLEMEQELGTPVEQQDIRLEPTTEPQSPRDNPDTPTEQFSADKIDRSPPGTENTSVGNPEMTTSQNRSTNDLLQQIMQLITTSNTNLEKLKTEVTTVKTEVTTVKNEVTTVRTEITTANDHLHQSIEQLKTDFQQYKQEIKSEVLDLVNTTLKQFQDNIDDNLHAFGKRQIDFQQETRDRFQQQNDEFKRDIQMLETNQNQKITVSEANISTLIYKENQATKAILSEEQEQTNKKVNNLSRDLETQNQRLNQLETKCDTNTQINTTPPQIHITCPGSSYLGNGQALPKFNGRIHNPCEYLNKLKRYYLRNLTRRTNTTGEDDTEILHEVIDSSFESHASRWWEMIKNDIPDWTTLERKFLEKYWSKEVQKDVKRKMENEKYRPDGRLTRNEYFIERVIALRSVQPRPSDDEIVAILAEHFEPLVQDACRVQNITTIEEFEALLQREDLQHHQRSRRNNQPTTPHNNIQRGRTELQRPPPTSPRQYRATFPDRERINHRAYQPSFERKDYHFRPNFERNRPPYHQQNPSYQRTPYEGRPANPDHPTKQPYPTAKQKQT